MLKKFLPAIALMFVFAITFAGRPPEKKFADRYLIFNGTNWVTGTDLDAAACSGAVNFCAIVIPINSTNITDAEAIGAVQGQLDANHSKTVPFTVTRSGSPVSVSVTLIEKL